MDIALIKLNPNNPRIIKDDKFKKLVQSIKEFPEMLEKRPIVVNKEMIVLGGNMRLKACIEAGMKDVPVIVADWSEEKQREFIIKDNVSGGEWDWDQLANDWYAVKKGSKGNWASDRKQTTVWDIESILQASKRGNGNEAQVHGTQKPVECMGKPIGNHDGDVYDPFLGSGTTMVAAHQLNRKCYGMEIDPKYCQVIIDRMLKLDPSLKVMRNGQEHVNNEITTTNEP